MTVRWNRHAIGTIACVAALAVSSAFAEIPKLSQDELREDASEAFSGEVVETYERTKKSAKYERTYGVAEIAVESVEKGSEVAVGDRVFVRYWGKRWVGAGDPPPDHYGHWNVPSKTDSVVVYVKGDRKTGYDVLSPNGFYAVEKAAKGKSVSGGSK
ncbi:MAG: hypothetical protein M3552_22035 [Planctomycetota bacterium]|nr:hypothetical protein [Planctomycetota bacterium]